MKIVDEFSERWIFGAYITLGMSKSKKGWQCNTLPHGLFSWICCKKCDLLQRMGRLTKFWSWDLSSTNTLPLLHVLAGKSSVLLGMLLTARKEWQHMAWSTARRHFKHDCFRFLVLEHRIPFKVHHLSATQTCAGTAFSTTQWPA